MDSETLEAKLRNQLSPIYGLADLVLLIDEKEGIKQLCIEQAKQAIKNKEEIDNLLVNIENNIQHLQEELEKVKKNNLSFGVKYFKLKQAADAMVDRLEMARVHATNINVISAIEREIENYHKIK